MYAIRTDTKYRKDHTYKYLREEPFEKFASWTCVFPEGVWAMSKEQAENRIKELSHLNYKNLTIVPYKTALLDILTDIN